MAASHNTKPRFQVDLPKPPRPGTLSQNTALIPRPIKHQQPRFRVDFERPRRRQPRAEYRADVVRQLRNRYAATLAQRRQLHKGALLAVVCLSLIAVGSTPFVVPLIRSHIQAAPRTSSIPRAGTATQTPRDPNSSPLPPLIQHVSTTDRMAPDVAATSAFVLDAGQGWILFQKNADTQRPIASLAKIMTLLLVVEHGNLDQEVHIGSDAAALVNSDNSYMGVSTGEVLTVRELLYGLIVASGNDAAVALADYVSGSPTAFVTLMNSRAAQLGLTNTTFVSPDGGDDGNRASARDIAVLASVALLNPEVQKITSTYHYHIAATAQHKPYDMTSSNDLLSGGRSPYLGVNGIKTGFTNGAMYSMAFSARVNGHLLVGVVFGDPTSGTRIGDVSALLDWAIAQVPCRSCDTSRS